MTSKCWETRRKHFPNNEPNKRAIRTRRKKYGKSCVSNPKERSKKLSEISKKHHKKMWETRHKRYGKTGIKDPEQFKKKIKNTLLGNIPWNKGLTKDIDPRVDVWKTRRSRDPNNKFAEKTWNTRKQRYGHCGVKNPEEVKRKMKNKRHENGKKGWKSRHEKYGKSGVKNPKKFGEDISNRMQKTTPWNKGLTEESDERVAKNAENYRKTIKNLSPQKKEEWIRKSMISNQRKPTNPEKRITKIINDHNIPFQYHGNRPYPGLNGRCPDFVSTNNSKKIIEYDERYWHQDKDRDQRRNDFYKTKGFQVLCLDEDDLNLGEEYVLNKIESLR